MIPWRHLIECLGRKMKEKGGLSKEKAVVIAGVQVAVLAGLPGEWEADHLGGEGHGVDPGHSQ